MDQNTSKRSEEKACSTKQVAGAEWVLRQALKTDNQQSVLIVYDEHTARCALCFELASRSIGAIPTRLCIPSAEQEAYSDRRESLLDDNIRSAIDNARRVVFLQKRSTTTNRFRLQFLRYSATQIGRRTASMPGITEAHLLFCRGDLDVQDRQCKLLADMLVRCRRATLRTVGSDGIEYTLDIELGTHKPILSTGRIPDDGGWGNVPSGETFVVPDSAFGTVAINGSILNCPLQPGEEVLLTFDKGKVTECRAPDRVKPFLSALLFDDEGHEVYQNCSILAELGIGTNDQIPSLTGLPILDEKKRGTVHLGLGNSAHFDGPTVCDVHNDYTILRPSLFLDGHPVTRGGELILDEAHVYPNWASIGHSGILPSSYISIGRELWNKDGPETGRLHLKWASTRGHQKFLTQVGDAETAELAVALMRLLSNAARKGLHVQTIERRLPKMFPGAIRSALALLEQFNLVRRSGDQSC